MMTNIHRVNNMINFQNFDLNLLRVFLALMDERSVSRAADRLGITQPATSNALSRLRLAINDDLLVRRGSVMVPTQLALDFIPFVRSALQNVRVGMDEIQSFDPKNLSGQITIGIDQYAFVTMGTELLALLRKEAPNLKVSTIIAPPHLSEDQLRNGEFNFIISQVWQPISNIEKEILFTEQFVGLARSGHPILNEGNPVSLDTYLSFAHILFSEVGPVPRNVDYGLARVDRQRMVFLTVPSLTTAAEIVEKSDDIINLGGRMSSTLRKRYDLVEFTLPLEVPGFEIGLLWPSQNSGTAKNEWFRQIVSSAISVNP